MLEIFRHFLMAETIVVKSESSLLTFAVYVSFFCILSFYSLMFTLQRRQNLQ